MKQPLPPTPAVVRPVPHGASIRLAPPAALLMLLLGCAAPGSALQPLATDRQVVLEGRVASVDTAPMAYDGDALVVLDSAAHGAVTVHIPARTNLCRAQGLELLPELRAGDRLRVEGLATGPGNVTVCQEPTHSLQRID